jgi:hypothetical protein
MNKVSRPFLYIEFLVFLKYGFSILYRTVQGIARRGLAEYMNFG